MVKAVIFDLDGTLLDRDTSVKIFINGQYERFSQWFSHIPKETYTSRFLELDCRGYVWKDKVYQQLVKEFQIKGITWEELLEDYLLQFRHSCVPFPHLIPLLEELKRRSIVLGVITNGKKQFQMDNIKSLGIEPYFKTILVSEAVSYKKPEPQIFMMTLKQLGTSSSETIFVGDHPEKDIQGARQVGMITVWKKDNQWQNVKADYIIDDLLQLLKIIEEMKFNE
jgi:putative hydrolase of the HAD superfamily